MTSTLQDCKDRERYEKPDTDLRGLNAKSDPGNKKEILIRDFCLKKKISEIRMNYKVNNSIIQMLITSFYNCMMAM